MRPAHLHFLIYKPGYKTHISQVYLPDDPNIETDVQFGVTRRLLGDYVRHETRIRRRRASRIRGTRSTTPSSWSRAPPSCRARRSRTRRRPPRCGRSICRRRRTARTGDGEIARARRGHRGVQRSIVAARPASHGPMLANRRTATLLIAGDRPGNPAATERAPAETFAPAPRSYARVLANEATSFDPNGMLARDGTERRRASGCGSSLTVRATSSLRSRRDRSSRRS